MSYLACFIIGTGSDLSLFDSNGYFSLFDYMSLFLIELVVIHVAIFGLISLYAPIVKLFVVNRSQLICCDSITALYQEALFFGCPAKLSSEISSI